MLLLPAEILFTIALVPHFWFELPGVAFYGLWYAKFCDVLEKCHYIPAFFTNEPGSYHVLQLLCLFAWGCLTLSTVMLMTDKLDTKLHVPRKRKNNTIATLCLASAFAVTGGLYLFYHIIDEFPREGNVYPEMKWAAVLVSVACGCELLASLLMLEL